MAISEWRWKASRTVSDGLTGNFNTPHNTSSSSSNLWAANSVSEPANWITTVSHWFGGHWPSPSSSRNTPSFRGINSENFILEMADGTIERGGSTLREECTESWMLDCERNKSRPLNYKIIGLLLILRDRFPWFAVQDGSSRETLMPWNVSVSQVVTRSWESVPLLLQHLLFVGLCLSFGCDDRQWDECISGVYCTRRGAWHRDLFRWTLHKPHPYRMRRGAWPRVHKLHRCCYLSVLWTCRLPILSSLFCHNTLSCAIARFSLTPIWQEWLQLSYPFVALRNHYSVWFPPFFAHFHPGILNYLDLGRP